MRLNNLLTFLILIFSTNLFAQQDEDSTIVITVERPLYTTGEGAKILIDGAHHNFHTYDGRFNPFARLLAADGYQVSGSTDFFTKKILTPHRILVISNALNEVNTNGNFDIELDCNALRIDVNNLSTSFISGAVNSLEVRYFSGDARFEGRNLIAQNVDIFQRSSNDMIINAQQSLTGEVRGTGDVILVNTPPIVGVEQFYTGQLIFED